MFRLRCAVRRVSVLVLSVVCAVPVQMAVAPSASADDVGPFSYVGFEATVERAGETARIALFDDAYNTLRLSHGGRDGTSLTPVRFSPGYGWQLDPTTPGMAGPLTDGGWDGAWDVSSGEGPGGVHATALSGSGATWTSGFPGRAIAHSNFFVIARDASETRLLRIGTQDSAVVAPGATVVLSPDVVDVVVEPVVAPDGTTSLRARGVWGTLYPSSGYPKESELLANLGVCPQPSFLVADSAWLVYRCGTGPVRARDLADEQSEDVVLNLADPALPLVEGERPSAFLADGWLAYALAGELRLVDLMSGEDSAVLRLRGVDPAPLATEVSVARSGGALAVVPEGSQGEALLIVLSDSQWRSVSDPYVAWYSARTSPAVGQPLVDPEQTVLGSRLPTEAGALYAWRGDTAMGRVHEVRGAIDDNYWDLGGPDGSALGYPVTDELGTPDGRGRFNHFERGSVYWTPTTGAREIRGGIRDTWSQLGWERSALGYPTTNELGTPDGRGRFNHFERGSVYWTPTTGAREIRGAFRTFWSSTGWERGWLGYPVTNESPVAGGQGQTFEYGHLRWDAGSGRVTAVRR